jgi:hypothetical protein
VNHPTRDPAAATQFLDLRLWQSFRELNEPHFVAKSCEVLRKLMHLEDGLGEVIHLVEKEDSQAKSLVR